MTTQKKFKHLIGLKRISNHKVGMNCYKVKTGRQSYIKLKQKSFKQYLYKSVFLL